MELKKVFGWRNFVLKHYSVVGRSGGGQVVSVLNFYPTIWVRFLLMFTVFSEKIVFEKNENKQKRRPGLAY